MKTLQADHCIFVKDKPIRLFPVIEDKELEEKCIRYCKEECPLKYDNDGVEYIRIWWKHDQVSDYYLFVDMSTECNQKKTRLIVDTLRKYCSDVFIESIYEREYNK